MFLLLLLLMMYRKKKREDLFFFYSVRYLPFVKYHDLYEIPSSEFHNKAKKINYHCEDIAVIVVYIFMYCIK